jgi:hypothetical protein
MHGDDQMTDAAPRRIPAPALGLGLGGLVPFFVLAASLWYAEGRWAQIAAIALAAYGGVILAFMGGVHWGAAMLGGEATSWKRLTVSVLPALIAWPAILFMPVLGLGMLLIAFVLLLVYDLQLVGVGALPAWYRHLRIVLTLGVALSLAAAILGLLFVHGHASAFGTGP